MYAVKMIPFGCVGTGARIKAVYFKRGIRRVERSVVAGEGEEKEKLASSLSRTRRRVYELATCNDWDWFGTFTVDAASYDRSDLLSLPQAASPNGCATLKEKRLQGVTCWCQSCTRMARTGICMGFWLDCRPAL